MPGKLTGKRAFSKHCDHQYANFFEYAERSRFDNSIGYWDPDEGASNSQSDEFSSRDRFPKRSADQHTHSDRHATQHRVAYAVDNPDHDRHWHALDRCINLKACPSPALFTALA
jgi:hypothetical protein